ncbi:hypothetical protein B0T19DRAFT_283517 [Cercophora scortea]|uniref:Uncharacterized protein n=1 Tax=Cercophora scortea TaxID=314031 RepID=A0AAE0I7W9_9PEZI|nr:hypothetical protein B0T19DRAFT_283517 [Cercophora scortea]
MAGWMDGWTGCWLPAFAKLSPARRTPSQTGRSAHRTPHTPLPPATEWPSALLELGSELRWCAAPFDLLPSLPQQG